MTDERYDGTQILSNLSGLPKTEVQKIFEQVKVNIARLHSCPRHKFDQGNVSVGLGKKVVCVNCHGEMGLMQAAEYIRGYEAAGGNADDVWPGYHKDKV